MSRVAAWRALALAAALAAGGGTAMAAGDAADAEALPADCPPPPVAPTTEDVQRGLREARDAGFLWRLRKDGRESWLYGTMHAARFEWMFPGPTILAAMRSADRVGLELDVMDPAILEGVQKLSARKPGARPLPPALAARLARAQRQACVAPSTVAGLRPELGAVAASIGLGHRIGLEAAYGIDPFLDGVAHGLHKEVRSLETPQAQISLLVSDDPREVARTVSETLDEVESGDALRQLERLATDWHEGKLEDLAAYADWCGCVDTKEKKAAFEKIVDARNPGMARQFAAWHAEGRTVFMAVGSLHMIGPRGLPRLLAAEGFEVERVR